MSLSNAVLPYLPDGSPDPNLIQRQAATPEHMVWVGASAGSGKTKVLTDRVLRLLLPDPQGRWSGAAPHRILCITFTKAAAAEMALRVAKRLENWAVCPEEKLTAELASLFGTPPSVESLRAARRLFSEVLDAPGGLNILTIHSFCQSILGRFPLESQVTPGFSILEDQASRSLLSTVIRSFLMETNAQVKEPLARLAIGHSLDDLEKNILTVLGQSRELLEICSPYDANEAFLAHIRSGLGLENGIDDQTLVSNFLENLPEASLQAAVGVFCAGSKSYQTIGDSLRDWLRLPLNQRPVSLTAYKLIFLTTENTVRKLKNFGEDHPEILRLWEAEGQRFLDFEDKRRSLRIAQKTSDLLWVSHQILTEYNRRKKKINALDFNDLIIKTRGLLEQTGTEWVHYKLDGGIDHILVDEAQDTNSDQWAIIKALSQEFFSGVGRDSFSPRSLFVVGDEKQSIFSFHGADPAGFSRMRRFFEDKSVEAERIFNSLGLDVSFRTSPPVLQVVDQVFSNPALRQNLGLLPETPLVHYAHRSRDAGVVELWPVREEPKAEKQEGWELPFGETDKPAIGGTLSQSVAMMISGWLQRKEILESKGRPIEAGDVLVLVQKRGSFVMDLIRHLKQLRIPVSGVDRMVLTDHIAVQDCLALGRFARLPEDDLVLACLLKSPFIRLGEEELMNLALGRGGSLWEEVKKKHPPIADWLSGVIHRAGVQLPFDFFDESLTAPCPADLEGGSGWRAFATHLGPDALDPLGEFLTLCLQSEGDGTRSLEQFLVDQDRNTTEIKREMEEGGGQVRIMTVHASKGLEAPIVILPDTTATPSRQKTERLFWPSKSGLAVPIWAARADDEARIIVNLREDAYRERCAEYIRLMYVALTRARDRLYLMGNKKVSPLSWYTHLQQAFAVLPSVQTLDSGVLRFQSSQLGPVKTAESRVEARGQVSIPSWLRCEPPLEPTPPQPLMPSRLSGAEEVYSPLDRGGDGRFQRGVLTHKLLQFLPEIPCETWQIAGETFLSRNAKDTSDFFRHSILKECLRILTDPVFGEIFGPHSLAEVPLTGLLGHNRILSGQIDRLVILPHKILIVDFKTNRPSPLNPSDIPAIYLHQMASYRAAIARIYRDREILCGLLWTDEPRLVLLDNLPNLA